MNVKPLTPGTLLVGVPHVRTTTAFFIVSVISCDDGSFETRYFCVKRFSVILGRKFLFDPMSWYKLWLSDANATVLSSE